MQPGGYQAHRGIFLERAILSLFHPALVKHSPLGLAARPRNRSKIRLACASWPEIQQNTISAYCLAQNVFGALPWLLRSSVWFQGKVAWLSSRFALFAGSDILPTTPRVVLLPSESYSKSQQLYNYQQTAIKGQ